MLKFQAVSEKSAKTLNEYLFTHFAMSVYQGQLSVWFEPCCPAHCLIFIVLRYRYIVHDCADKMMTTTMMMMICIS